MNRRRAEDAVRGVCERNDDGLCRLRNAVGDDGERKQLDRFASRKRERARRECVVGAGARGSAHGVLHRGAGGEGAIEHGHQEGLRSVALALRCGRHNEAHAGGEIIGVVDGERVRRAACRDAGEACIAQTEERGLASLAHTIVANTHADVFRKFTGCECDHSSGNRCIAVCCVEEHPVDVVARRGAAAAGVFDRHGFRARDVERHGNIAPVVS